MLWCITHTNFIFQMTESSVIDAFVGSALTGNESTVATLMPWMRARNLINEKDSSNIDAFTAATSRSHSCIVKMLLKEPSLLLEANSGMIIKNHLDYFLNSDCWDLLGSFMRTIVLNNEGRDRITNHLIKLMQEENLHRFTRLLQYVEPEHPNNEDFIVEIFYHGTNGFILSVMNFFRKHLSKIVRKGSFPGNAITAAIDKASFSCCSLYKILQQDFLKALSKTKMITEDIAEHRDSLTLFLFQELVSSNISEDLFLDTLPFITPDFKDYMGASISMKVLENPLLDLKVTKNNMKLTKRLHRIKALINGGSDLSSKDNKGRSVIDYIRIKDRNKLTPEEFNASNNAVNQARYTPMNELTNEDLPEDLHLVILIRIATDGTTEFKKGTIINCIQKDRLDLAYFLSKDDVRLSI